MRRGTTPTHIFTLPFEVNSCTKVRVVYAQREIVKITKTEADAELTGNQIIVKLSQEDTLRLDDRLKTEVQVRVLTADCESMVSDVITLNTKRCLNDEVL